MGYMLFNTMEEAQKARKFYPRDISESYREIDRARSEISNIEEREDYIAMLKNNIKSDLRNVVRLDLEISYLESGMDKETARNRAREETKNFVPNPRFDSGRSSFFR